MALFYSNSGIDCQSEARVGVSSLNLKPHRTSCADGVFLGASKAKEQPLSDDECFQSMRRVGLDTLEIARIFKVTEATVYNSLAKSKWGSLK
jgi:hypothetical protein